METQFASYRVDKQTFRGNSARVGARGALSPSRMIYNPRLNSRWDFICDFIYPACRAFEDSSVYTCFFIVTRFISSCLYVPYTLVDMHYTAYRIISSTVSRIIDQTRSELEFYLVERTRLRELSNYRAYARRIMCA